MGATKVKRAAVVESLEGRELFSAGSPGAVDGGAIVSVGPLPMDEYAALLRSSGQQQQQPLRQAALTAPPTAPKPNDPPPLPMRSWSNTGGGNSAPSPGGWLRLDQRDDLGLW